MATLFCYAQNVGIGTKNPQNKLHVAGGVRIDSLASQKDSGLILHNLTGDLYSLKLTGNKNDMLRGDGTFSSAAAVTDAWLLGGNAGTDTATNFFGTTDEKPVMFRLNNNYFGTFSQYNIAIGTEALGWSLVNEMGKVGGNRNVAIGNYALWVNGSEDNVAVGDAAIKEVGGKDNTAVGAGALWGARDFGNGFPGTSIGNVAVGKRALSTLHFGLENTAIGTEALSGRNAFGNTSFSGSTAVGYHAMKNYAPYEGPSSGNNVSVGAYSSFSNQHGAENTVVGYMALYSAISPFHTTAVGYRALAANTAGNGNTAVGHSALSANENGDNNTALGTFSLSKNTAGANNTAIGYFSLTSSVSGRNNTATGAFALRLNTTGMENTATGQAALNSNTAGSYNTSSGSQSLFNNTGGSYNSAYGFKALFTNTSGGNNTASGFKALNFNTTGSNNTAAGFEALNTNTTGNNNTAFGYRADVTAANLTNATAIGYNAKVNASNKVRIGNAAVTVIEGQVPFTTPSDGRYKFNVHEDVKGLDFVLKLRPVTYQFDVRSFDKEYVRFASSRNADYEQAAKIKRTGFIAQEVDQAAKASGYDFSGIVRPANADEHYSLSYESFVVPLVKAVQEQQEIIKRQQQQIDELLERMRELERKN